MPLSPKDGQNSPVEDEYDPKHWKLYLPVQKNEGLWLEAGRTIASYDLYSNPKYRKPSDEVQSMKQKLRKLILCREDEVRILEIWFWIMKFIETSVKSHYTRYI